MSTTGQLTARAPVSPHANLTAIERTGTTSWGSAIWTIECTCGARITSYAPRIKDGFARCDICNPSATAKQIAAVLAALPGTYDQIEYRTKLSFGKVRYALEVLRANRDCFIGSYTRADAQGSYRPIFHVGDMDDVPCPLAPRSSADVEKRYRKRVKAAISRALAGGKEDPRYLRRISREIAKQTALRARLAPQPWYAALEVSHGR